MIATGRLRILDISVDSLAQLVNTQQLAISLQMSIKCLNRAQNYEI